MRNSAKSRASGVPVAPYYVELIRQHTLDPTQRRDKRGRRHARRPELDRHRDATLVSVLAYSRPRRESEALPLSWSQIGQRTITYLATKGGRVKPRRTRLLAGDRASADAAAWPPAGSGSDRSPRRAQRV
jgi:hypothetical protein